MDGQQSELHEHSLNVPLPFRMGRLAIFVMLLIVALFDIWQVFGAAWG